MELPERAESFLIGSCAEGFGNPLSDIDILIAIPPGKNKEPVFRHYTWVGEQRVEVYSRPTDDLQEFVERINALTPDAVADAVRRGQSSEDALEEDLEMYHRVLFAYPIRPNGLLGAVHALMDHEKLIELRAALEEIRFRNYSELALAAEGLALSNLATAYARSALEAAAASWGARQGQTYAGKKFLSWRLARAGLPAERIEKLEELTSTISTGFLHRSLDFEGFVETFGMPAVDVAAEIVAEDEVLRVRLTDQLWIGNQRRTVVVPSEIVGAFDASIGSGAAQIPDSAEARRLCFLSGLARLETSFGRIERVSQAIDGRSDAVMTAKGFGKLPSEPFVVTEGVSTLVDAAMAISTAGFLFANCKEDAIGAARTGRWRQFDIALGRMRQFTLDAISYSETFRPAPVESDAANSCRPSTATELQPQVREAAVIRCRDAASAERALAATEVVFSRLPPEIFGQLQYAASSAFAGMAFIELVFVWGKVAKGMGKALMSKGIRKTFVREWDSILEQSSLADLPRDMRVHVKPEKFQFNWARSDDLRAAVTEAQ
ncbi:MAG: nucleotidyltransferase domain-containing protein [Alphaproteobacteria bacterium]|nr:nucleotidyltransferase domain-containing protein [Alphaproteobacteria bacterium]MBV9371449.1 nucleotidyltransferase domain-containing protein [Alphaproteobacteria bacterium]MBV9902386.1 nucleotidyltransferase domain-containing protein [Alphaproteobacteria bacterium]